MEKSNIIKQAKSDIFKEIYTIINFYIRKGAKPSSLKKYYKSNKKLDELIEDIKSKSNHLINNETEYKLIVKEVLNDILDDFIANDKDEKIKNNNMKHLKEYNKFNEGLIGWIILSVIIVKFILHLLKKYIYKQKEYDIIQDVLIELTYNLNKFKIPIHNLSDRYYFKIDGVDNNTTLYFRLLKEEKILNIDADSFNSPIDVLLTDTEYETLLKLINENENENK